MVFPCTDHTTRALKLTTGSPDSIYSKLESEWSEWSGVSEWGNDSLVFDHVHIYLTWTSQW